MSFYLLSKIEGCLPPIMTGTVTLNSNNKRESKISAKKFYFSSLKSENQKKPII